MPPDTGPIDFEGIAEHLLEERLKFLRPNLAYVDLDMVLYKDRIEEVLSGIIPIFKNFCLSIRRIQTRTGEFIRVTPMDEGDEP